MDPKAFHLVSLGCAKNTVDSDSMAALLQEAGYYPVEKPNQAGVVIVNTCGFIQAARQESLDTLREFSRKKKRGQVLICAGCLTERYRQRVIEEIPGLDGILGTRRWMDIVDVLQEIRAPGKRPGALYHLPEAATVGTDEHNVARISIQGGSAYLKIADGCRRPCAFCSIPLIKGTTVSRPPEKILAEARLLAEHGIRELLLIAQDTTDYGRDLGMKDGLAQLLEALVKEVPEMPWIRVLYAYPGYVTDRLIEVMASHPQVLPYLDMPLQHASVPVLRAMQRPANMEWVYSTIEKMRTRLPGLALRTTFIVGYPGEMEADFQELLDFIQAIKFDHLGAFTFSYEEGTASAPLGDPIPQEVKLERLERLMLLQEGISLSINQGFIGKTLDVLVEGRQNDLSIARSYRDAPEIDGLVIIEGEAPVGEIIPVQITGAMTHDLTARTMPVG